MVARVATHEPFWFRRGPPINTKPFQNFAHDIVNVLGFDADGNFYAAVSHDARLMTGGKHLRRARHMATASVYSISSRC